MYEAQTLQFGCTGAFTLPPAHLPLCPLGELVIKLNPLFKFRILGFKKKKTFISLWKRLSKSILLDAVDDVVVGVVVGCWCSVNVHKPLNHFLSQYFSKTLSCCAPTMVQLGRSMIKIFTVLEETFWSPEFQPSQCDLWTVSYELARAFIILTKKNLQ